MIGYSLIQKFISVLMIFILSFLPGCVSSRTIGTNSEIPVSSKYYYIVYGEHLRFHLWDVVISDGILSGKINKEESSKLGNKVKIYVLSDSETKVNTEGIFTVSITNIRKVEIIKINPIKTTLVGVSGLIFVLGLVSFHGVDPF